MNVTFASIQMWPPGTRFIQDTAYTELWTLLSINNTLPIHVWHATDMADKRRVDITLIDRYYTLLYTNYELHPTTPYWSKRLKRPLLIKGLFLKVLALPDVTHSPKSLPPSFRLWYCPWSIYKRFNKVKLTVATLFRFN